MENRKKSNELLQREKGQNKVSKAQTNGHCGLHCIKIKNFSVKIGDTEILSNVNLHIHCGNLTAVIGKNGAGKTTLIRAILGEVKHEGSIEFKDMRNHTFSDLKIGYVPQHLNLAKNTPTSVYDLFASYVTNQPVFLWKSRSVEERIKKQLDKFQAGDLMNQAVCDLSGGQLQRVLLSIATTPTPNLLLLDEPVSGIDRNGMRLFYENIDYLKKHEDLAVILISHDLDYVSKYADHVILLNHAIMKEGKPEEVYQSSEFKATFGPSYGNGVLL